MAIEVVSIKEGGKYTYKRPVIKVLFDDIKAYKRRNTIDDSGNGIKIVDPIDMTLGNGFRITAFVVIGILGFFYGFIFKSKD